MVSKLILGDCLEIMADIPDGSIDAIIADLPYGLVDCHWDSVLPFCELWAHYKRVIKPNGAIVLTSIQPFTTDLINNNRKWFKYEWIWSKNLPSGHLNAKKQPLRKHENILIFCEGVSTYNPQYEPYMESTLKRFGSGTITVKRSKVKMKSDTTYSTHSQKDEPYPIAR